MFSGRAKLQAGLICCLLAISALLLYWPARRFDFVNYDDPVYVVDNVHVNTGLSWKNVHWAFVSVHASNWHPLTWLSHMLDVELFGLGAGAHHLVSVGIHTLSSVVLFLLLVRMTREIWPSALVAALFAWHPLHVESVAWIAERKDTLAALFWFLTTWFYVIYTERRTAKQRVALPYVLFVACFALGILSKPMLVTLPFTLLILDFWPLKRVTPDRFVFQAFRPVLREKLPLFVIAFLSCLVTFLAQAKGGAVASLDYIPVETRVANAAVAYGAYLTKMVNPARLAVFYPHLGAQPALKFWLSLAALLIISLVAAWQRNQRPYLLAGWLWFLGTLIPVIGLVQVGDQAFADRYTYIPLIGIFIAVAWSLHDWMIASRMRTVAVTLACATALIGCMFVTRAQLAHWQNGETLFTRALAVTRNNYVAHNNLGNILGKTGKREEAKQHYLQALEILPHYEDAHLNLGRVMLEEGDVDGATRHFLSGVKLKSRSAEAHYNLGTALAAQNHFEQAVAAYEQALSLNPKHTDAHYNLGIALTKLGRLQDAEVHYREALKLNPRYGFAHYNLGLVLQGMNRYEEAAGHFQRATELSPDYLPAKNELGATFLALGNFNQAAEVYRTILKSDAKNAAAHSNLGLAMARLGNREEAEVHFAEVVRIDPGNPDAHYNWGNALADLGRNEEAAREYAEALRLNPNDQKAKQKLEKLRRIQGGGLAP